MKRTWGEIKNDCLDLGFEKANAVTKNIQAFVDAYNWAVNFIANTDAPVYKVVTIETDGQRIDLDAVMDKDYSTVYKVTETGTQDVVNYSIIANRYLDVDSTQTGKIDIWYRANPEKVTSSSADSVECPLEYRWAELLPYLMANRLWMDDDASKAGYYWNLYQDMKASLLATENMQTVSVTGGIDIDRW